MATVDRLKEEIGWLKVYFALFFAVDVSLAAWLPQNARRAEMLLILGGAVGILTVTIIVALTQRRVYKLLEQLETR